MCMTIKKLLTIFFVLIVIGNISHATVLQHLTIDSSGLSGNQLVVTDGNNADLIIKENGRVSLGTTASNAQLTIKSHVANSAALSVISSVGSTVAYFYESQNNGGMLYFYDQNGSSSTRISGDPLIDSYFIHSGLVIGSSIVSSDLKLDVEGKAGAQQYCDASGGNCAYPADISALIANGVISNNRRRFVFEGDSLTDPSTQWVIHLKTYDPMFSGAEHYNIASTGETVMPISNSGQLGLLSDYTSEAVQYKKTQDSEEAYYLIFAGINDLVHSISAVNIYEELKKIWAAAKADDFKVVAFTIHPLSLNNPSYTPSEEVQRILLNEFIASNPNLYDYLVRPDLIFFDPDDPTYYGSDGIHFNAEGYHILAKEVARTIATYPHRNTTKFVRGTNNTHDAVYLGNGSVGIGTNAPSAKLDVNGNIKVGNSSSSCSSSNAGEIRFDGMSFQGCNGSSWVAF